MQNPPRHGSEPNCSERPHFMAFSRWCSDGVFFVHRYFWAYYHPISFMFWSPSPVLPLGREPETIKKCEAATAPKILGSKKPSTIGHDFFSIGIFASKYFYIIFRQISSVSLEFDEKWSVCTYLDRSSWTDLARSAEKERKPSRIFS